MHFIINTYLATVLNNGSCALAKAELIILFFMKPKVVTTALTNNLRVETRYFTEGW